MTGPLSPSRREIADIAPGDTLPPFARHGTLEAFNRYAAVNDEFVPIHMDRDAGRAAGFPGAIGMGRLEWSYLHTLLRGWLRPTDSILSIEVRFDAPFQESALITAQGRVRAILSEGGVWRLSLDLWIEDEAGAKLVAGKAVVALL